jgi:GTPase SAR1 family protein
MATDLEMQHGVANPFLAMSNLLLRASEHIHDITGFLQEAEVLQQKANRLQHQTFTIALFGAFSAGKSSVANCLLGDMVLPVSPNPTTAAINKILPPSETFPHGTVRVFLKSRQQIWEDIQASLQVFGITADTIENALSLIQNLSPAGIPSQAKPHFSFLKAVIRGWDTVSPHLGNCLNIDLKEFKNFVVKEEKACFVEVIELYYDSPLAKRGIVLVDTPGADSINARHTGVAFEYIKNADAILFVTYYNHAFGKADEEFLIQLGRVKDAFSLDKMFFLVNASDLAQSPEELDGVMGHVRKNLIRCGISNPRIYPVSSQTGLLARLLEQGKLPAAGETLYRQRMGVGAEVPVPEPAVALERFGIVRFESDFFAFMEHDLGSIALREAARELRRIDDRLSMMIQSAHADQERRQEMQEQLAEEQQNIQRMLDEIRCDAELARVRQEMNELVYYVKQRLFLRYRDLFLESFNPSVLQDEYRDIKQRLKSCLQELLQNISFTIQQEMRATSLRLDKMCQTVIHDWIEKVQADIANFQPAVVLRHPELESLPTPDFVDTLKGDFSSILSYYKNAKDFFEQGKKDTMRDELENRLKPPVDQLLAVHQQLLETTYLATFESRIDHVRSELNQQIHGHFEGMRSVLSETMDISRLQEVRDRLQQLLEEAEKISGPTRT